MDKKKLDLLKWEEMTWRLKSRDIWVALVGNNTNFFHNYASYKRNIKSIWDLRDEEGISMHTQNNLENVARRHFNNQFKD